MKIHCSNQRGRKLEFAGSVCLPLVCLLFAGCPASPTQKVVIRGSNTVGEELIPSLTAAYKTDHPSASFDLEFKGTMYGFGALMGAQCDIAAASREPNMNELRLARDRGIEFNDYVIGSYSVAVIVNPANPVTNLTQVQVRDLFTGVIQNWKEVGGRDTPVNLYVRDPISGTYLGFRELAMENKPYALNVKTFTNYALIAEAVAKDPDGIGYSTINLSRHAGVKGMSIGGVAPVEFSVNEGKYPYARVLRLYTNKQRETPAARELIQFVQAPRGQQALAQTGFVPRP